MRKTITAAAVAATLVGGGLAGAALFSPQLATAQDATANPTETPDTTDPDRSNWAAAALAPLVTDGTITQTQADAVIAALADARPARGGHGGDSGHGGGFGHHGFGAALSAAAEAIGITQDELRTRMQDGDTLAEVAQANDVEPEAVVDALVAESNTRIDQAVTEGDLTEEQATELRAELSERITAAVNDGFRGPGFGGRGFRFGGPGFGDDDDESATESATETSG